MNTADIVILVILGFGAVKGYLHGFIVEVFSFLGFFIGLILALQLTIPVTAEFFSDSGFFDLISIGVFVALFILLSVGIRMGARILKKMIDVTLFGTIDNMVGAVAGLLKWAFLVSMIAWVFDSVGFEFQQNLVTNSLIFPYIVGIGPWIFGWLGDIIPFIHDLIDSMDSIKESKDTYLTFAY